MQRFSFNFIFYEKIFFLILKGYDVIALLAEKALKMNQKEGEEILSNITKILGTLATGENLEIQVKNWIILFL